MSKKNYLVIADFVDKESGEQIQAGTAFEADVEREPALKAAGVIGKELSAAEVKKLNEQVAANDPKDGTGGDKQ